MVPEAVLLPLALFIHVSWLQLSLPSRSYQPALLPHSERALKRVQELLASLAVAKGHLKQVGGVSEDDLERQRERQEHQM